MSKLIFTKTSTEVPAPDAGQVSMYVRTDGNVVLKGESGEEKVLRSGTDIQIPVPLAQGGTGSTSQQGAINALTNAPAGTTGYVLTRNGSGNAVWAAATGGDVTYPIAINKGGTGAATAQAAITALTGAALASPGQVLSIEEDGSVAWADAGIPSVVPINKGGTGETTADAAIAALTGSSAATAGQVLTKAQDGTLEWTDVVSSTDVIAIAQGGTGQATRQAALNALANAPAGTEGQVLLKVGSDVVWGSAGGGSGPTANLPDPTGQDANQVVVTSANSSYILTSATNVVNAAGGLTASIVNAKGDLIAGTADNTVSRLGVGTNGKVLAANSTTATGLEWIDRTTLTGSTVNALPRVTGANAMSASGVTLTSSNALTVPAGGQLVSNGPTYAKAGLTVSGNIVASGGAVSVTGNISSSGTVTAGSGLSVTGNIAVTGTVDGRDVSADGAKLDSLALSSPKSNTSTSEPTVNDDIDLGYVVGSIWNVYSATQGGLGVIGGIVQYVCTSNANGAAVWKLVDATRISGNTVAGILPVIEGTRSGDTEKGFLYSRAIAGGSNILVELVDTEPTADLYYIKVSAPNVLNENTLTTYGTDLTPNSSANPLTLGTVGTTYSSILIGSASRTQIEIDQTKPIGINTAMSVAGANTYARYIRSKGARGLMVGNNPVPTFAFEGSYAGELPSGNDLRLLQLIDFGDTQTLPFQTGHLDFDFQLRGTIRAEDFLTPGTTSLPQFRWYLVVSPRSDVDPTLQISNGSVVPLDGYIAASGIVYAPLTYGNKPGYVTDGDDTHFHFRFGIDLKYTSGNQWVSRPRGSVFAANRHEALGTFGANSTFPASELSYILTGSNISSLYGFGTTERPRVSFYISQSGTPGTSAHGIDRYGSARGGVLINQASGTGVFTPRLVDRNGNIVTAQYRKSDGTIVTY